MLKAFKERLERRPKPAPLYREVRNMPPPEFADQAVIGPGGISFIDSGTITRPTIPVVDPYEWFEPKR